MSVHIGWVKGLIPGQPQWVVEIMVQEFDRYAAQVAELRAENEQLRELHKSFSHNAANRRAQQPE
jgi:hypothetical protein